MTERLSELADINESYINELTETKLKHSQEIKDQADAYEVGLKNTKFIFYCILIIYSP